MYSLKRRSYTRQATHSVTIVSVITTKKHSCKAYSRNGDCVIIPRFCELEDARSSTWVTFNVTMYPRLLRKQETQLHKADRTTQNSLICLLVPRHAPHALAVYAKDNHVLICANFQISIVGQAERASKNRVFLDATSTVLLE